MSAEEKQRVLEKYKKRIISLKELNAEHKEIRPLDISLILTLKLMLHPTKKNDSLEMTKKLVTYLCDKGVTTASEIYEHFGWSDKPVLRRLKILKEFGLVRKESNKFYLATPRLYELKEKNYLERLYG